MSHVPHDLHAEFPLDTDRLHALKTGDAGFRVLQGRYDALNQEIYKIEASLEAAEDARLEDLKKQRLSVLDEIAASIAAANAA